MRHLLDSHSLLWYTLGDPRLSGTVKTLILDPANEILISPASYWEIAIKVGLGKLTLHRPYEDFIDACLKQYGFTILPIEPRHTARLIGLPFHHRDPFDRLLVSHHRAVVTQSSRSKRWAGGRKPALFHPTNTCTVI